LPSSGRGESSDEPWQPEVRYLMAQRLADAKKQAFGVFCSLNVTKVRGVYKNSIYFNLFQPVSTYFWGKPLEMCADPVNAKSAFLFKGSQAQGLFLAHHNHFLICAQGQG